MDESNNAIFTHAKMEYTAQLVDVLTPNFFDGIKSIYDESKTVHRTNNPNNSSILILFRLFLEKVPTWSNEVIETETNRIIDTSNCDWLNDLITAVFISHTKILTAIGTNNNSNIELIIPKTINFIHKCYINIAREIWKNPYLFNDYVTGSEYQMNMRTVELLIKESIENTIRKALPVKEILKQQLDIYDNTNNEKNKITNDDIRKMLLEEIRSLKSEDLPKGESEHEEIEEHDKESNDSKEQEELRERVNSINEKFKMDLINETNDISNGPSNEELPNEELPNEELPNEEIPLPKQEDVIPEKNNYYESPDGYVSPDEEEIKNKCENLNINTIPDVVEQEYDNVDIYSEQKKQDVGDKTLLENYLNDADNSIIIDKGIFEEKHKEDKEEDGNNIKGIVHEIVDPEKENKIEEDPLFKITKKVEGTPEEKPSEEKPPEEKPPEEKPPEEKPPEEKPPEEKSPEEKSPEEKPPEEKPPEEKPPEEEKEIISVSKNDDTETVDLFFEDVSNMLEKKGIDINKENDKYTLFDDAIIEEEGF